MLSILLNAIRIFPRRSGSLFQSNIHIKAQVGQVQMSGMFSPNDWVVYTREKHSLNPGPRAKNISPSPHGELYSYEVDKYWIVRQVHGNELVLETRKGKTHRVAQTDRRLRKAYWWERLLFSRRFPSKTDCPNPQEASAA